MNDIKDLDKYNLRMTKSVLDKMFFLDKIIEDEICVIDYGCANGDLLKEIIRFFPDNFYVGYDISNEMIEEAKENLKNLDNSNYNLTDDFDLLKHNIDEIESPIVVVLSSILHEIYSYRSSEEIEEFWNMIFGLGDYVVIRDMIPSKTMDRMSDINDVRKLYRYADRDCLLDFESHWGSIENNKNLIHYLLKYRYRENWDREVRENYFSITKEKLYRLIPSNFEIVYSDFYLLPYIRETVLEDFSIDIKDATHLKLILKRLR